MCAAAECLQGQAPGLRLKRLLLVCPVNPYSAHGTWLAPVFGTRLGAASFRRVAGHSPSLFSWAHGRLYADRSKIPAGSLDGYRAPLALPDFFDHALSIVRTWTKDLQELEKLLPTLWAVPALLMWGSKDPAVNVSSMEPLASHFAQAQKIVFSGVGHLPYEECPEEFNRAVIEFLTRQ